MLVLLAACLGGRAYPQVTPPVNCACGAALGERLLRLRHAYAARAAHSLPAEILEHVTTMAYAFPKWLTQPTVNLAAGQGYDDKDQRSLPNPATASSLASLERVVSSPPPRHSATAAAVGAGLARVTLMFCPDAAAVVGADASRAPLAPAVVPCPAANAGRKLCHTALMEELRVALLEQQAAAAPPGTTPWAFIAETDMLWLGHPASLLTQHLTFATTPPSSSRVGLAACDVLFTMHDWPLHDGNINSGVMLMRNSRGLRKFWAEGVVARVQRMARRACSGGQNQDAILQAWGVRKGRFPAGTSFVRGGGATHTARASPGARSTVHGAQH